MLRHSCAIPGWSRGARPCFPRSSTNPQAPSASNGAILRASARDGGELRLSPRDRQAGIVPRSRSRGENIVGDGAVPVHRLDLAADGEGGGTFLRPRRGGGGDHEDRGRALCRGGSVGAHGDPGDAQGSRGQCHHGRGLHARTARASGGARPDADGGRALCRAFHGPRRRGEADPPRRNRRGRRGRRRRIPAPGRSEPVDLLRARRRARSGPRRSTATSSLASTEPVPMGGRSAVETQLAAAPAAWLAIPAHNAYAMEPAAVTASTERASHAAPVVRRCRCALGAAGRGGRPASRAEPTERSHAPVAAGRPHRGSFFATLFAVSRGAAGRSGKAMGG